MKTYEINLFDDNAAKQFSYITLNMVKMFESDKFKQFLLEKCKKVLDAICDMSFPVENEPSSIQADYMSGMGYTIEDDTIILYNESEINVEEKNISETTKAKYPAQLSLAKIIEYGIGYTGAQSSIAKSEVEDWEYDKNKHSVNGWYYKDDAGNIIWTNGFAGRFIFYKLRIQVEDYIDDWILEYIEKEM